MMYEREAAHEIRGAFSTSEMAQFFGITKEGVRFMEKEGIIHAIQNEKNGYKYYDREQVISLQRIRSYRSLGFSLDEAKQMLSNTNRESLLPQIDQKLNELAKKEHSFGKCSYC